MRENQLSVRKTTPTRLTIGIQRTKKIVRITCGTYLTALASRDKGRGDTRKLGPRCDSLLRWNTPFHTWYEIYYFLTQGVSKLRDFTKLFNIIFHVKCGKAYFEARATRSRNKIRCAPNTNDIFCSLYTER